MDEDKKKRKKGGGGGRHEAEHPDGIRKGLTSHVLFAAGLTGP